MKVRATKPGFYGLRRRRVGDEFEIDAETQFSTRWMEKTEEDKASAVPKPKGKGKREPAQVDQKSISDTDVI